MNFEFARDRKLARPKRQHTANLPVVGPKLEKQTRKASVIISVGQSRNAFRKLVILRSS